MDYFFDRLFSSGMCTPIQIFNFEFSWEELHQMHEWLDLREYLDWESHEIAHREAKNHGSR